MLPICVHSLIAMNDCLNILVVVWLQKTMTGACIIYITFLRNRIVCDSSYYFLSTCNVPATELKNLFVFSSNLHNTRVRHIVSIPHKRTELSNLPKITHLINGGTDSQTQICLILKYNVEFNNKNSCLSTKQITNKMYTLSCFFAPGPHP